MDERTPAPAPQAPDFDAEVITQQVLDAWRDNGFGGLEDLVLTELRNAYAAGHNAAITPWMARLIRAAHAYRDGMHYDGADLALAAMATPDGPPPPRLTPAEQALITAARAYAAVHALPGTTKPTTATEHAIDAVLDACLALAESEAANG